MTDTNSKGERKPSNTDRNGDPIVGDILDLIDQGDSKRYAVAVRVAAYVRQQLEAKHIILEMDAEGRHSLGLFTDKEVEAKVAEAYAQGVNDSVGYHQMTAGELSERNNRIARASLTTNTKEKIV